MIVLLHSMNKAKKIVVIGGESSGKSTLCKHLAEYYHTVWVKEYAREYLEKINREYEYDDLLHIAKEQILLEEDLFHHNENFVFHDTDLLVMKVWSEHKFQKCHDFILEEIDRRKYDAYILTAPDIPWEADRLREHPEPERREYFFSLYKRMLENMHTPHCIVSGDEKERLIAAVAFLEEKIK